MTTDLTGLDRLDFGMLAVIVVTDHWGWAG